MTERTPDPVRRLVLAAPALLLFIAGGGCKNAEPAACNQTDGLAEGDVRARTSVGYADRGGDPARHCVACSQWLEPPEKAACGACKVLKGPIHPRGTCNLFTPEA